ncbi:MAG: HEPN domain-containing protein [Planctomycetota bacterium]
MAETWQQLAQDNRTAAFELFGRRLWRSCVSRAYFAVFCAVAGAAEARGVQMPAKREGPSHANVDHLIQRNLGLSAPIARDLSSLAKTLYRQRVIADYFPSRHCLRADAQNALEMLTDAFDMMQQ